MQKRKLDNTDLELTTVGVGTWAIGGENWKFNWGPQDEEEAIAGIIRGIELGANWIDTAAVYGNGRSELLVGRALARLRPTGRPIVATKCGRIIQPDGDIVGVLRRESIIAECESSLKRLGVDTIDLYQIHWPDPEQDLEEGWSAMADLVRQGKVRHAGVSNFSVSQMERIAPIHSIASLQPQYSMIVRDAEKELLSYCGRSGIGVVCYSPMCKGLLTGTFTAERVAALDERDHRRRDPKFNAPQLDVNLGLVEGLKSIAERSGHTVAQLAIAWTLRRGEVTSAIVGVRRPSQIEETAAAADWELSDEDIAEIDGLLAERDGALARLSSTERNRE